MKSSTYKRKHPMAVVRAAMGLSQEKLRDRLNSIKSTASIQSIELGRMKVSEATAVDLALLSGVAPETVKAADSEPRTLWGERYTAVSYQQWQASRGLVMEQHAGFEAAKAMLSAVMLNAAQQGKYFDAALMFGHWANTVREKLGLVDATKRVHFHKGKRITVKAWQDALHGLFPVQSIKTPNKKGAK